MTHEQRELKLSLTIIDLATHVFLSVVLAVFFRWLTGGWSWSLLAILGGIFIDLDHFIDHFLHYGIRIRIDDFFHHRHLTSGRVYVLFHSWEIIFLLWGLSYIFAWITPVAAGMTVHLLVDYFLSHSYDMKFLFLLYRWRHGFDLEALSPILYVRSKKKI